MPCLTFVCVALYGVKPATEECVVLDGVKPWTKAHSHLDQIRCKACVKLQEAAAISDPYRQHTVVGQSESGVSAEIKLKRATSLLRALQLGNK